MNLINLMNLRRQPPLDKLDKWATEPPLWCKRATGVVPMALSRVGVRGLELPTSTSRTWRANQLCYTPSLAARVHACAIAPAKAVQSYKINIKCQYLRGKIFLKNIKKRPFFEI